MVFPLDRLHEMADKGLIGSVAGYHYSFMCATDPSALEPEAVHLAEFLIGDRADAAILIPELTPPTGNSPLQNHGTSHFKRSTGKPSPLKIAVRNFYFLRQRFRR